MTTKTLISAASLSAPRTTAEVRKAGGYSLRHRLPVLIFALLAMLGSGFSWMAYVEVERALRVSGGERINVAGGQIADLLGQSAMARLAEARRLASDPAVQQSALAKRQGLAEDVPEVLQTFASRNPLTTVWISDGSGRPLSALMQGSGGPNARSPSDAGDVALGIGPLRSDAGHVWYSATVSIPFPAERKAPPMSLTIQRVLGSNQAGALIERLIGSGATLTFGNATGDTWTDLSKPVAAPPVSTPGSPTTYVTAAGESRIGVAKPIAGTPWLLWAEVSERSVLGPATALLKRMVPITLVFTLLGAFAVYTLSGRVARPLEQLADATEAIAGGDYTRRVSVTGGNEVARLGAAFNLMATQVAEAHDVLEARVQSRTRELELAREELDQFFSLSLDLLCISGMDGRFKRVNPAWEQVLGWSVADLTSMPYLELVHPDDQASTIREANGLAEGTVSVNFENRYRTKDGQYRWLNWTAFPLPARGLFYAVAHDVTEQKRTELALHQYGSELKTANRELESFSYSVSHDLRAPLRSIDGFSQALLEDCGDKLDHAGRDYLARIRAAAQRMGTLIDDLLSLSRVTRGELQRTQVNLSTLAAETARRLQEQDPGRRVEWRIQPDVMADGDARWLQVALDNLLGNAWKFTAKRDMAVIEFGVAQLPSAPRAFLVRDNGAGFDMAHASKLFGAFQRLHGGSEFPGTGIGLATVQRIVRRHGGRIWSESAPDVGAAFFFTLESQ